jgi:TatD DNase family protein
MELIDSHCHLDADDFSAELEQVLARARSVGVHDIILPGISARLWPRLRQVAARVRWAHAAYGLHPMYLAEHRDADLQSLAYWVEREQSVAIGECGLDYYLPELDRRQQTELFVAQIRLAKALDLPLIIHARRAVDDVLQQLRRHGGVRGVVHSFAGSLQQAQQLFDLGFLLGIGGPVTYQRARRLRRVVQQMPDEALLLETDAPDQPGCAHRGERNEPAYLAEVLDVVAELRNRDRADMAAITTRNARRLFNLPDDAVSD